MAVWFCAILMVSTIGIISPINVNPSESEVDSSLYTTNDPIYINGNADFTEENGVTGGTGTQSDPYIIEGWDISASSANAIEIQNTNVYFIIRNCYVHDGKYDYNYGIYFYKVQNGKIENTSSSNNDHGVYLWYSDNNNIFNNSVSNNWYAIYVGYSDNNNIFNNTVSISKWGISLYRSSNNNIFNNSVNSNNIEGIYMGYSSNNNIFNNTVSNNNAGICLSYSSGHNIFNNSVSNNNAGIRLRDSGYSTISDNNCMNNSYGIYLSSSSDNNIFNNNVSNNWHGVYLRHSSNNIVGNNTASKNDYGIYLYTSSNNTFNFNNLSYNNVCVYVDSRVGTCFDNKFHHNNFINEAIVSVTDEGMNTCWDGGNGEGNYWSNYIGSDDGSDGRIAGDGVGDTNIPHMGLDNYPLMVPVGQPYTPPDITPPLISSVGVSGIADNSAIITWITDENGDSRVNYSINSDLSSNSTQYNSTLTTSHSITLTGLTPSTTYYFEVSSTDGSRNIATDTNNSNYYKFTTLEDTTPPTTPTGLAVTSLRSGNLNITWNLNTDDTQTYSIYSNKTGTWTLLANITHPQNSYVDIGLTSGTTYYYKISAWDEIPLESSNSGVVHDVSSPMGTISGVVEDEDGNPIEGVTVTIYEDGTKINPVTFATTNSNGEYSVDVPSGTYDVKVEESGYDVQWEKDVAVTADQTATTDMTLPSISSPTTDILGDYWWMIILVILIIVIIIIVIYTTKKKKPVEKTEAEGEKQDKAKSFDEMEDLS